VDGAVVPGALSNDWLVVKNVGAGQQCDLLNTNSAPSSAMLYANRVASSFRTNAANPAVADSAARPAGRPRERLSGICCSQMRKCVDAKPWPES